LSVTQKIFICTYIKNLEWAFAVNSRVAW